MSVPVDPRAIVDFLRNDAGRPLEARELAAALDVPSADFAAFRELLQQLEADGVLYRIQRQRYAVPNRINLLVGRLQTTRGGAGFLVPEDGTPDLLIPAHALNTAVDRDRVVARVEHRRAGKRPEGSVVRVLERARTRVVGTFRPLQPGQSGRARHGFVVPDDRRLPWDVFVAPGRGGGAADGDRVVIRITDWGSGHRGPTGEVDEVLGPAGEPGVDVLAIIRMHELPAEFPPEVERAAERIGSRGLTPADIAEREDLRDRLVFTIDPVDAKDHDDALSIEPLDAGWRVGVHIADVSHYVRAGEPLDEEALQRGTSVYLVDRVIPMLPHALSSGICSLVAGADRLALTLFVDVDADGAVRAHRLTRSIINSRHRLAYEQAQAVLDGTATLGEPTDDALRQLCDVARTLRALRRRRGSIDFDLPESRVLLDAAGEPTDVQRVQRLESHRLVEDLMLLANEVLARRAADAAIPFIYRVHEPPVGGRMEQLRDFAATFGHRLGGGGGSVTPRDLQRLLDAAAGRPEEALLSTVVLRSLKQARYSEQRLGHFGLAVGAYTHFTSPIRRYPDLVVHRILAASFIDGRPAGMDEDRLASISRASSDRERVAVAAERDSKDLKKVQFMQRHLGAEFDGTIATVTSFGCFVLLDDFFVEGLVHVSSLGDDYYLFVEEQFALIGERTRRRLRTGDRVRVRVAAVDLDERRIDFELVDPPRPRPTPARRTAARSSRRGRNAN